MKNIVTPGIKFLFAVGFGLLAFSLICQKANAYQYDNGESSSQLILDKRIRTVNADNWQDNLSASQVVLKNGDALDFDILVKNSGDKELKNIEVKDYLPNYLKFIFGPASPNNGEIVWTIDKLNPGEERSFQIRVQVDGADQASSEGNFCLINKASAKAESGEYDEDTASYCLVGAEKLPQAGVGNLLAGTLFALSIGSVGVVLRKFGRGEIL